MANFRFFQETGLIGGTANLANRVFYVDSYNGDDSNVGSNIAPFQTIQKAIDSCTGAAVDGADIIVSGYFQEGDFVNISLKYFSIIAEGNVIIDGSLNSSFNLGTGGYRQRLNTSYHNSRNNLREYGYLTIQNFTSLIVDYMIAYNTKFVNIPLFNSSYRYERLYKCVFKNVTLGGTIYLEADSNNLGIISHCDFINSVINFRGDSANAIIFQSNYLDTTSLFDCTKIGSGVPLVMNYNLFEGTIANKIKVASGTYTNVEAFKVANPTKEVNGLASTTVPLLNDVTNEDYTLQEASPLLKAGHGKKSIGAFEVADITETNSNSAKFDYVNIDTTTGGEITLTAPGVGTATTKALYHHQIAPKKRLITKILAPNLEQSFGLGEVMGSNLAAANSPVKTDIEIQYTTDTGTLVDGVAGTDDNYNGTWLRVPIGEQPFHDTVNNVGNDDPLFDIDNAVSISSKYVKMKITLRDNEVAI